MKKKSKSYNEAHNFFGRPGNYKIWKSTPEFNREALLVLDVNDKSLLLADEMNFNYTKLRG